MEQRDVLSLDSVDRIRGYVKHKYVHLPKEKHAEIVADAIVKIIERQLPPFEQELRQKLCNELIKQVVVREQRPVSLDDIDHACEQFASQDVEAQQLWREWRLDHGIDEVIAERTWLDKLTKQLQQLYQSKRLRKSLLYAVGCLLIVLIAYFVKPVEQPKEADSIPIVEQTSTIEQESLPFNELPALYQYEQIDIDKLKSFLESRESKLADEPYFSTIIATAKEFNLSVVLLFAITGQEQGFVHREHEQAEEIANNPFNVFHSWKDYNTTIEDSTAIAARTLVNLSKDRPEDIEPIVWINRKYAEDPNWSKGVTSIFQTITNYINN